MGTSLTVYPESFIAPPQEVCYDGDDDGDSECLQLTLRGVGGPHAAKLDEAAGTVAVDLDFVVDIASVGDGFPNLGADCQLGPISGTLASTDYNSETGLSTLADAGATLVATTSCGDQNDKINTTLGLPGTVDSSVFAAFVFSG